MKDDRIQWELERGRGILTPSDRKYLLGESEPGSTQSEYNTRSRIRKRIRNALHDLDLILITLEERDLDHIFTPEDKDTREVLDIQRGLEGAIGLAFYVAQNYSDSYALFERLLRKGIHKALPEEDAFLSHTVDFNILTPRPVDVERIAYKIESFRIADLAEEELRFYVFVQSRSDGTVSWGTEAAEEFLDNVERLKEQDFLSDE